MKLYEFEPHTGKYLGSHDAQVDEWQTTIKGETCYIGEANAVWDEPPQQEGYTAYYIGGEWVLKADPTLEELKAAKIMELKKVRDDQEVLPIEYNGHSYDYDEKARDRINAAIIALDMAGAEATLQWTTADNTNATVTVQDLRNIIAAVAMRSNTLHEQYRVAKEAVNAAETKEEVEAVTLEGNADV